MRSLTEQVRAALIRQGVNNCSATVGVSGGADSVCLLLVLGSLREEFSLSLRACHVNHGIRGEEAGRDEAFVRALCDRLAIPLQCVHADVPAEAKRRGLSEEACGRDIRREAFEACGDDVILLAHHRGDQAETVLMNLARGTGLRGLAGIRERNGSYVRPLLGVSREEITGWLSERGETYVTDSTNLEDTYTRNRVRREILPAMAAAVNPQAERHIAETAARLAAVSDYMDREEERYAADLIENADGLILVRAPETVPELLLNGVLFRALAAAAGGRKDLTERHINALSDLVRGAAGRRLSLPGGIRAQRTAEGLAIGREDPKVKKKDGRDYILPLPGRFYAERFFASAAVITLTGPCEKGEKAGEFSAPTAKGLQKLYADHCHWLFDYDKILRPVETEPLVFRHRRPGDRMLVTAGGGHQKIKALLIDRKIPAEKRDEVWLLACGEEVLAAAGIRRSEAYPVREDTRRILAVSFTEKKSPEGQTGDGNG